MSKKPGFVHSLLICTFLSLASTRVDAQITPDNTLGAEASKLIPIGEQAGISLDLINGGAKRGNNLFHSFTEFNIKDGQSVYFASPSEVINILTRVTGGNASNILGTLGVDGGANLFLINPNGILFGQNASLDIRGSFIGTTANGVQFGNQGNFSATDPVNPGLLTINPSALFFNQINHKSAIVNKSVAPAGIDPAGFDAFGLRVPDGKSLLLVGGDISMEGGQLNALGGRVELGGVSEAGNINLLFDGNNFSLGFPEIVTRASVSLTNQARVYVEGASGGDIALYAQNIEISNGSRLIAGIAEGLGAPISIAGDITLNATGEIKITDSGSIIGNLVRLGSQGNGGNITFDAGSFSLRDGAQITASTFGNGSAGNVTVSAKGGVSLTANASILSTVELEGTGTGGNININAATLSLLSGAQLLTTNRRVSDTQLVGQGGAGNVNVKVAGVVDIAGVKNGFSSGIFSRVGIGAVGNGGNITIDAGSFQLHSGAVITASTFGNGLAGNVTVSTKGGVSLADANIFTTVGANGVGKGGNIDINAATLSLLSGAQLLTATREAFNNLPAGRGDAGDVNIKVAGVVDIAGVKNGLSSAIFSRMETGTVGNGGDITIDAGSFSLRDGAQITASTFGQGNAGNVTVNAKSAVLLSDANIFTTLEAGSLGKGGNIDINAATLSLLSGAQLLTATREAFDTQMAGQGDAGDVNVKVTGVVDIAGVKNGLSSAIFSRVETGTQGNGGSITIDANSFYLRDGALLDARTENNNRGGNITVNVNLFETTQGGQITTNTLSNGRAGKITINAAEKVLISSNDPNYNNRLTNFPSSIGNIGANAGFFVNSTGSGTTGDIEINSPNITLDNQGKLQANSTSGNGGNINLKNNNLLLLRRGAQISTNAGTQQQGGDGGNIDIDSGFIVAIPKENSDITANAFTGRGGNVNIRAQGLFGIEPRALPSSETSDITASSDRGVQGQISITEPDVEPEQGLIELPEEVVDATRRVAQICPRFPGAKPLGEFTITGRGSLPPSPLEALPGTTNTTKLATLDSNNTHVSNIVLNEAQNTIVEAQGWVKNDDGSLELVAMASNTTLLSPVVTSVCTNIH